MGVPFTKRSSIRDVTADGNGNICVYYPDDPDFSSALGEIPFDIDELKHILKEAEAQKAAWDAYTASDCHEEVYEDTYERAIKS